MHTNRIASSAALSIFLLAVPAGCAVPSLGDGLDEPEDGAAAGGTKPPPGKTGASDAGPLPSGNSLPAPPSGSAKVQARGCVADVTAGQHRYDCNGIAYDVMVPPACAAGGCGLVLDVHGMSMNAEMEDNNTHMRALGAKHGYVVVQPNANPAPPLSLPNWAPGADDEKVLAVVKLATEAFVVDRKRVHATGFSAGGSMAFRLLCKHADEFASIAVAAGGGCTFAAGDAPSREVPILFMQGTDDALVSYTKAAIPQRDQIIAAFKTGPGAQVAGDPKFRRTRYTSPTGTQFEFLAHDYVSRNPLLRGHCYPGSTDRGTVKGQLMRFDCSGTTAFTWGDEAMAFFIAHPGK